MRGARGDDEEGNVSRVSVVGKIEEGGGSWVIGRIALTLFRLEKANMLNCLICALAILWLCAGVDCCASHLVCSLLS